MKHINPLAELDKNDPARAIKAESLVTEVLKNGVNLNISGSTVVVSGGTFAVKEDLKILGMKYSKDNHCWQYAAKNAVDAKDFMKKLDQTVDLVSTNKKLVDLVNSL